MEPARLCAIEKELPVGWGSSVWAEGFPKVPKALGLISSTAIRKGGKVREDAGRMAGRAAWKRRKRKQKRMKGQKRKEGGKTEGMGREKGRKSKGETVKN